MLKDELIALGLRGPRTAAAPAVPAPERAAPPVDPDAVMRAAIAKLITLLLDLVGLVELTDDKTLRQRLETCRDAVVHAPTSATVNASIEECTNFCRRVLTEIGRQRAEQKKEMAGLVGMVREALAIVSGDGQSFGKHLHGSMQRIEALVQVDDVRVLKKKLVEEITELRGIAEARQKEWEKTTRVFTNKVDALEKQLKLTKLEASLDALTHVANRGAFDRTLQDWIKTGKPFEFVLAMIDIDNFKTINDTHGHGAGDRALVAVAQALQGAVRHQSDMVGRVGGDEFAVLMAELPIRQAENRLRMVSAALAGVNLGLEGAPLTLTLSIGIADRNAGDTFESIRERADTALYEAKHLGRNRIVAKTKPTLRDLLRK